jgi:DNA-binding MarR family transcriptional regulator
VINKFLENGIVTKKKCESDKRISFISLTDLGEVLASTNTLESQRAVSKMADILSPKELKQLVRIFDKFGVESK